ncbi:MAG TPA: type II secretion system protein [Clostridia bacterium]|nr:type II secretion system protein [Clostridia bacterium]
MWQNKKIVSKAGFSLIEMIVVITILGLVAVIASGFLLTTMMAGSKAEATKEVRQNGDYAISVMETLILSSRSVGCTAGQSGINVTDLEGNMTTFLCQGTKITSNSASLTGSNVAVSNCQFTCETDLGIPTAVGIGFSVSQAGTNLRAAEKATMSFSTKVITKNVD